MQLTPLIAVHMTAAIAATAIGAVGYGNQRFRLPAEPGLVVLAAAGASPEPRKALARNPVRVPKIPTPTTITSHGSAPVFATVNPKRCC